MDTIISEANDTMINQLNFGLPETSHTSQTGDL